MDQIVIISARETAKIVRILKESNSHIIGVPVESSLQMILVAKIEVDHREYGLTAITCNFPEKCYRDEDLEELRVKTPEYAHALEEITFSKAF